MLRTHIAAPGVPSRGHACLRVARLSIVRLPKGGWCATGVSQRLSCASFPEGERQPTDARRRVAPHLPHLPRFTVGSRIMKPVGASVLPLARARNVVRLRRAPWRLRVRAGPRALSVSREPRDVRVAVRPHIRRGDPLNLSILLSGGKETNQDSPSNGE